MSGQRPSRSPGKLLSLVTLQERCKDKKAVSSLGGCRSKIHLHLLGNLFTHNVTYAALARGTMVIILSDSLHLWASLRFSMLGHPHVPQVPLYSPTWCHDPISFSGSWIFILLPHTIQSFLPLSSGSLCPITLSAGHVLSDDTLVPNFCPTLFSSTSPGYSTRFYALSVQT